MSGRALVAYFVLLGGMPTGACLLRVWVRQQNVSLGYVLHQKEERREALRVELRKLEVARASGRTPRALMTLAKSLGLGPARPHQFVGVTPAAAPSVSADAGPAGPSAGLRAGAASSGRASSGARAKRGSDAKPK